MQLIKSNYLFAFTLSFYIKVLVQIPKIVLFNSSDKIKFLHFVIETLPDLHWYFSFI